VYLTLLNGVKEAFVTLVEQQFFGEQKGFVAQRFHNYMILKVLIIF